jgi:hypothetical protein
MSAMALDGHTTNYLSPAAYQIFGMGGTGGRQLPPTNLDSFVTQAGGQAELIYGDEGTTGLPPLDNFKKENRIDAGIFGINDLGLTTGHGSVMPDAWGADEFLSPPGEWTQTGSKSLMANPVSIGAAALDARMTNRYSAGMSNNATNNGANQFPPPEGPPPPGEEWNPYPVQTHGAFDGYMTVREANDFNSGDPQKTAAAYESFAKREHGGLTQNDQFIIHGEILRDW